MKRFILFTALTVCAFISQAQFLSDFRLTNNPGESVTSPNNAWCIAASGDHISVVWRDNRNGSQQVFFKHSSDGGTTWGDDLSLTTDASFLNTDPAIAVSGSVLHVVWDQALAGNKQILYRRSADNGANWDPSVAVTGSFVSNEPSVAASGSYVYAVWHDWRNQHDEIYFNVSSDGGVTWGQDVCLTDAAGISEYPSVAAYGTTVHVAWQKDIGNNEIYYIHSGDHGATWSTAARLTNDTGESLAPSIAASGNSVHVTWYEDRDGNNEIYYKRSTDGGNTWGSDQRLTNDGNKSYRSSICTDGQFVHVTWIDNRDQNYEIYYKKSSNNGTSWGSDLRLTNDGDDSWRASVAVSGPAVHVVWEDTRDGNYEIYYKKDPLGSVGMSELPSNSPRAIRVCPNPASSVFHIISDKPFSSAAKTVFYDVLGKEIILPSSWDNGLLYDAGSLPDGIYTFYVSSPGQPAGYGKLIIRREP